MKLAEYMISVAKKPSLENHKSENIQIITSDTQFRLPIHSGQLIKGGGDKIVPIDRNEWKFGIPL